MIQENLYHGTEINRGKLMISNGKMNSSVGDKHWLGNGSYFYEEDFYAYKWIRDMYKDIHKKYPEDVKDLFNEYQILIGKANVNFSRIFNLNGAKHKIEYDKVYEKCIQKKEYSKRFSQEEMPEGVILNIMFEYMGYNEEFDVVVATFTLRKKNYKGIKMRLNYMPEKQICFKNLEVIKPEKFYPCEDKIEEFQYFIDNLNYNSEKISINTYSKSTPRRKFFGNNIKKID